MGKKNTKKVRKAPFLWRAKQGFIFSSPHDYEKIMAGGLLCVLVCPLLIPLFQAHSARLPVMLIARSTLHVYLIATWCDDRVRGVLCSLLNVTSTQVHPPSGSLRRGRPTFRLPAFLPAYAASERNVGLGMGGFPAVGGVVLGELSGIFLVEDFGPGEAEGSLPVDPLALRVAIGNCAGFADFRWWWCRGFRQLLEQLVLALRVRHGCILRLLRWRSDLKR